MRCNEPGKAILRRSRDESLHLWLERTVAYIPRDLHTMRTNYRESIRIHAQARVRVLH